MLHLTLTNKEEFVGGVKGRGGLGCRDHDMGNSGSCMVAKMLKSKIRAL